MAILEGDIDKAFKYTYAYYPNVLKDNEQIYFRLRCRKFIEMIRRCSELDLIAQGPAAKRSGTTNGHAHGSYAEDDDDDDDDVENDQDDAHDDEDIRDVDDEDEEDEDDENDEDDEDDDEDDDDDDDDDVFEHEMELDDQGPDGADWEGMEMEGGDGGRGGEGDGDAAMKHFNLLQETIKYGQVLRSEFRDDHRKEVKRALEETFSLLAYEDPKSSVVAHLLEPSGRAPVAEDLNSAILGEFLDPIPSPPILS